MLLMCCVFALLFFLWLVVCLSSGVYFVLCSVVLCGVSRCRVECVCVCVCVVWCGVL